MCKLVCVVLCNITLLKSAVASITAAIEVENWFTRFYAQLVQQSQHSNGIKFLFVTLMHATMYVCSEMQLLLSIFEKKQTNYLLLLQLA